MKRLTSLLLLCSLLPLCAQAQQLKPFKAGDRVAFVGNSITDGGHYHALIWLYYLTRFPNERLWIANRGIGGDTSTEILGRLQKDVLDDNPTVVALTYGMNDAGMLELDRDSAATFTRHRLETARKNTAAMDRLLLAHPGLRVIEVGSSPYDNTSKMNYMNFRKKNEAIRHIIDLQRASAQQNGWEFIDFNAPMVELNSERQRVDSTFSICGSDRTHPDNDGHALMAFLFLKAQGMEGKVVADVAVDARQGKVVRQENCEITALKADRSSVAFDYLAHALPFPLDTVPHGDGTKRTVRDLLKVMPDFMEKYNSERLCVARLAKGSYRLSVDSVDIDTLDARALAVGINMAAYEQMPQYQQALRVMAMNEDRWNMERRVRDWAWVKYDYFGKNGVTDLTSRRAEEMFNRDKKTNWWLAFRSNVYYNMRNDGVAEACERYMETLVEAMYKANRPVVHHILITALK